MTGHGSQMPAMHLRSLERFDFDSVLLPYNFTTLQQPAYRSGFDALMRVCAARNVAVQTIKSIAVAHWMGRERTAGTWYEPLRDQEDIDQAVWWTLGQPGIFLNSAGDLDLLPRVLDAASRFSHRPSVGDMERLAEKTEMRPLFV